MFKGNLSWGVLALAFSAALVSPIDASPANQDENALSQLSHAAPRHILVKARNGNQAKLRSMSAGKGRRIKKHFGELGIDVVELAPHEDPLEAARALNARGDVEFAEPDYRLHASIAPNDPDYAKCWSFPNPTGVSGGGSIGAELAWNSQNSAEDVIVAVIDSGVRYTHEDLADNMWTNPNEIPNGIDDDGNGIVDDIHGFDAFGTSGDPWDDMGHGTHVAGTIGAVGNNGKGIAGVCWNVKIMALKFMDSEGWGDTSDAINCINYARKNGAKVINASWGGPENSLALRSAINAARNAGIIFVTAAGNEAADDDLIPSYPANLQLDNIVTVAAVNQSGVLDTSYSNWGRTSVDLAAPGTAIYSTSFRGDHAYEYMSGTSMAVPHVAGAIALLCAAHPGESHSSIIQRLYAGVVQIPSLKGKCVTEGGLNIGNLFPRRWQILTDQIGEGTITLSSVQSAYLEGTSVNVEALPASGFKFNGWAGDVISTDNPFSVLVNRDQYLTALFEKEAVTNGLPSGAFSISRISVNSNGAITIRLTDLSLGSMVESSTNLIDWSPLSEVTPESHQFQIANSGAPRRFYRIRKP